MTLVGGPCGLPVSALWEWLLAIACMAPSAVVIRAFQLQDCLRGVPCSLCAHCGCRPLAISPKLVSCPWEPWKPTWGHMVRSFMTADRCERREKGDGRYAFDGYTAQWKECAHSFDAFGSR